MFDGCRLIRVVVAKGWVAVAISFFKILFIYLFIYFCLRLVFVAACGLSLVAASGGYSALRCAGFSLQWLLLLQSKGSRRVGFSSCVTRAQLLCGMWDLPGPGLEPVSPALAGGFLTTASLGKPFFSFFKHLYWSIVDAVSQNKTTKKFA